MYCYRETTPSSMAASEFNKKAFHHQKMMTLEDICYGRPLLQAWLHPDSNTIPNNRAGGNSL